MYNGSVRTKTNDQSRASAVIRLAGTLGSVGLLVYLLHKQGWHDILKAFGEIPVPCALGTFGLMIVSRLATVARWQLLLRALGMEMPLRRAAAITFAGLFSSNFLPSTVGGDVARLAAAMQLGYSGSKSAASLVLDRLTGMLGMLMALPFGIPAFHAAVKLSTPHALVPIPLAGLSAGEKTGSSIISRARGSISRTLGATAECASRPYHLLGALAFTWVHMLCIFGIISLLLSAMNQPLQFWTIAGLWTIVYFATLVPISINGLGVQELTVTYAFTQVGVPTSAAFAVALVIRTLTMLASLPGALFVPGIMGAKRR